MSRVTISAALIVKNEEKFLPECLRSLDGQVDEVIIVDTGSTDRTPDIAREFGCKLSQFPWIGNFSAARNAALERSSGDWILYIDADERLVMPADTKLTNVLAGPDSIAHYVRFRPRIGFTPYDEIRLFRRDPDIRFRSVIHETVHPDILAKAVRDGQSVTRVDAGIDHIGYEGDMTAKYQRNVPLLRKAVLAWPDRVFLHVDLGISLLGLGETNEGLDHLQQAIDLAQRTDNAKHQMDGAYAWLALIRHQLESDPSSAIKTAEEGLMFCPDHMALTLAHADVLIATKRDEEAVVQLERLLSIDENALYDPLISYNMRIFRDWPADRLGMIHARAGRHAQAAKFYRQAADFAPEASELRHKVDLFSGLAKKANRRV